MKRLVFILLFLNTLNCQKFDLSLLSGGGNSIIWGKRFPIENTTCFAGYSTMVGFSYNINNTMHLRLTNGFSRNGYNNNYIDYNRTSLTTLFYISNKVKIYTNVGFYYGYNFANINYSKNDAGLVLGIGFKQNIYKNKFGLLIDVSNYFGMMNISRESYFSNNKTDFLVGLYTSF